MNLELALGRWLATICHPYAAWRRLTPRRRALLVGSYTGASYIGTLIALLMLS